MYKIRILIIDEEPRWIDFAKNSLVGIEVTSVPNIDGAVKILSSKSFDLVIASSIQIGTLGKLKEENFGKPIFITSSEPSRKEMRCAYQLGAKRYLPKTFDSKALKDEVYEILR